MDFSNYELNVLYNSVHDASLEVEDIEKYLDIMATLDAERIVRRKAFKNMVHFNDDSLLFLYDIIKDDSSIEHLKLDHKFVEEILKRGLE